MADNHLIRTTGEAGRGPRRTPASWLLLLPLLATGCAGQPMQMGTFAKNVPKEQAMVLPPPAGPGIVSVIERRYDNAVEQNVYLYTSAQTSGQNMFKAQFFGTVSPFTVSDNKLTSTPVTEGGIATEIRQALPGVRMVRSSFYVQNSYGPFGYAFGHGTGNDLCLYAWQQVRAPEGTISPLANYGSIQVRLRLCQSDATEERLLAVMYNYTITGAVDAGGWNPYGEPQSIPDTLGGNGAPIYPRPASNEPIVPVLPAKPIVAVRPAPVTRATRPVAPRAVAPRPVAVQQPVVTQPVRPIRTTPAVTVPRPFATPPTSTPVAPSVSQAPAVTRAPLVPSPSGLAGDRRAPVPPPACADASSGAANACR